MTRNIFLIFFGWCFLFEAQTAPQGFPLRGVPTPSFEGIPEPYNFNYRVENPPTSTFFGHNENGDASGRVTGSYFVQLPDGRVMNVEYFVDGDSGYVPKISFQPGNQLIGGPRRL